MHKQDLGKPRVCLLYSSFFVLRALTGGIESMPNQSTAFDVAIIGAGIVGCAAAFERVSYTHRDVYKRQLEYTRISSGGAGI